MKIVAIVPAKGISQRLENKNLYKINGKTLVERACEKLLESKHIEAVYLDSESEAIFLHCEHLVSKGLKFIKRPKELATNETGANEMMIYGMHAVEDCDLIIQTFATSPTITIETIDHCIERFSKDGHDYDSFFTVTKMQEYFWDEKNEPINFDISELPNSFELPPYYMETHGLYGIFTNTLIETKTRVGRKPMLIEVPKLESLDVNDKEDLEMVELMLTSLEK